MAGDLVFITGATGYLGYRVLVEALQHGYRVRAAVRSEDKISILKKGPSIQPYMSNLEFAVIPDIIAKGAYDDALTGVNSILHVASPTPKGAKDYERDLIEPAVQGTLGILRSAMNFPQIKRIVITSSIIAIIPWKQWFTEESGQTFRDTDVIKGKPVGPFHNPFEAYGASKTRALHASNAFVESNKPGFDVINIMPAFVIGKNELVTDPDHIMDGTNGAAFAQVFGVKNPVANPSNTVFVNDAALVHVLALDPKVAGGQNFIVSSGGVEGTTWNDAIGIIEKHFPAEVKDGIFPLGGNQPTKKCKIDSSRTEDVFGIKFKSYEVQVLSTANHYLDILKAKKSIAV